MSRFNLYEFLTPGVGETLEFKTGYTVSGTLIQDAVYRIVTDQDCWIEIDDGGGGMSGADTVAIFMPDSQPEYFVTTANQYVLHALGVTTSGLCNYIHMS